MGFDAIDVPAATRHGVVVCTAVGANHEAVADYAVSLMCALQRGLLRNHRLITGGQWKTEFRPGLWRATVGIVGLGRIGQAVARRCRGFAMTILAYEPYPDRDFVREYGVELVSLEELLRRADLVTLHCPATPENRHLINHERLALMKPTAHLVNTARGSLVDEAALHEALATGRIAGAGLDVFEKEPLFDSALFGLDNVVLSPHVAGIDETSEVAMADRAIDAILAVWRGDPRRGSAWSTPRRSARADRASPGAPPCGSRDSSGAAPGTPATEAGEGRAYSRAVPPLTNAAKPAISSERSWRTFSSTSRPSASNAWAAPATYSCLPNHARVPSVRSTGSHADCASRVPPMPGVAPMIATGLPPKTLGMSLGGRDSQSIAFLSTPGIELLYSGVTSRRPSAPAIRSFSSVTGSGIPRSRSTSPS